MEVGLDAAPPGGEKAAGCIGTEISGYITQGGMECGREGRRKKIVAGVALGR